MIDIWIKRIRNLENMQAHGEVCSGVNEIVVHEIRAPWLRATKCAIGDAVKREREVGTAIALSTRAYGVDFNRHTTERKLCRIEINGVMPCVVERLRWIRLSGTPRARRCRCYSIPPRWARSGVGPTTIGIIDNDPRAVGGCKEH